MLHTTPFRLTEPATWPWFWYLFLAVALINWLWPAWRRYWRRRAMGWPSAIGRVESAEVKPLTRSRFGGSNGYCAELGYSYSVMGRTESGYDRLPFLTEREAVDFIHGLKGRPVMVHYHPDKPAKSMLLDDLDTGMLRPAVSEAPPPVFHPAAETIPRWTIQLLWALIAISTIGLVVSLWVHLGAVFGRRVVDMRFFFLLHLGIFVVWLPAMLIVPRTLSGVSLRDSFRVLLRRAPAWMRYVVSGFSIYAVVNFLFFLTRAPSGGHGGNPPPIVWRGFSGHWMAFYAFAVAILYSAACVRDHQSR